MHVRAYFGVNMSKEKESIYIYSLATIITEALTALPEPIATGIAELVRGGEDLNDAVIEAVGEYIMENNPDAILFSFDDFEVDPNDIDEYVGNSFIDFGFESEPVNFKKRPALRLVDEGGEE